MEATAWVQVAAIVVLGAFNLCAAENLVPGGDFTDAKKGKIDWCRRESGAFSLFTRNRAGYTAIAARRRTLASGFLEALAQRARTLFVYAEEATPTFYRPAFGPAQEAVAVAVLLDSSAWRWTGNPLSSECTFADFVSWLEGAAS